MTRPRRICVVTGTRAEYGLLRWVMQGIKDAPDATLQVVATGMHLSPEFGLTYREIEQDGFEIDRKVEMLLSADTPSGVAKSMGLGMIGFSDAFRELAPDLLLLLGDRFEVLAAASAAMVMRLPIAHLHGGEATEGSIDEAIRHSVTKMSHLHFVAAEEYRRRVIQLGESPDRVLLVGGLGVDSVRRASLLGRAALEAALGFSFHERNVLVTFHPVSLESASAAIQMEELLAALDEFPEMGIVLTMPNADPDGRVLFDLIQRFVESRPNARVYTSLGQQRYFSCVAVVDAVVGNSSSGLLEAPSFHKATVNIGDRQRGRLRAASVVDCAPERGAIADAIRRVFTSEFQRVVADVRNPYGDGGAADRIVQAIRTADLADIIKKRFYDVPVA